MKKLTLIIAAVAMGFIMTSCGNKEKELMQKATEFYTQAETELKATENLEGFATFCQNFKQKFNDFMATYSDMKLSQETQNFLDDKEKTLKQQGAQKAGELFTPYLEKLNDFNIIRNLGILASIDDGSDPEKICKVLDIDQNATDEEIAKSIKEFMSAPLGIEPSSSDEELVQALKNWSTNNLGIDITNASEEESDKVMKKWAIDFWGIDMENASEEEREKSFKNWKEQNEAFFENYNKCSEFMPEELKERCEKIKEDMNLTYEILKLN